MAAGDREAHRPGEEQSRGPAYQLDAPALSLLFGHVEELVVVCDQLGTVVFASPSCRAYLGYDPASVIGTNLFDYIHPDERDEVLTDFARWVGRQGMPAGQVQRVRASDGSYVELDYDFGFGAELEHLGWYVLTLRLPDRAVADRRELFSRIHNEDRLVRLASAFLHVSVDDFDKGVDTALGELAGLDWVTRVSIWRRGSNDRVMLHSVWEAPVSAPTRSLPRRLPVDQSRVLRRLSAGEEVHIRSVGHLPEEWSMEREFLQGSGVRSMLAMPMMVAGEFTGFVMVEVTLGEIAFDASHVSTLRQAAAILAEAFTRHQAEAELAHRARSDAITGLANRWAFDEALEGALAASAAGMTAGVGVALVDLDRFKRINDTVGHSAGDGLLAEIGARLRGATGQNGTDLRESDGSLVARLGGDAFLVLHRDATDLDDSVARTRQLLAVLDPPFEVDGNTLALTASAGVVHAGAGELDASELLHRADLVMYRAKRRGGNRVAVDDEAVRDRAADRLRRETDLRDAIGSGGVVPHYQAEWDLVSGELVGAEALARWNHPTDGTVAGGDFIPLAEECGLIRPLGEHILRAACQDLARWRAEAMVGDRFVVRVNISVAQLLDDGLTDAVDDALADSGLPASSLCLELTESALLVDPERAVGILRQIEARGIGLAVDDFGTGYSSMLYLKRLPMSGLKIDREFVSGLPEDVGDRAIVRSIVQLADEMHLTLTAEGVEKVEQRMALLDLGCRRAQGFLLARPEPAAEFVTRLAG